jgi:L-ascorbate metabolism protein UlaG (beta-lactamase superfamily)
MNLLPKMIKTNVEPGQLAIWVLGGGSLAFKSVGTFGFVDPFFSDWSNSEWVRRFSPVIDPNMVQMCDVVLITHEHEDHCDPVTIKGICSNSSAQIIAPSPSVERLKKANIFSDLTPVRIKIAELGSNFRVGDLQVTVIQTKDLSSKGAVGYLLQNIRASVLFLGDSLFDKNLLKNLIQKYEISTMFIALGKNPAGRRYYFSVENLMEAALIVSPTLVVPIHWDLWTKTYINPESLLSTGRNNILILKRGEMISLPLIS